MGSCDGQRRSATGDGKLPLEKIGGYNWINYIVILYQERSRAMNKGRIKKLTALIMSGAALIALISYFIISSVSSDSNSSAREDIKGTVNELSVNDADKSASGGSSVSNVSVNETAPNTKKDPAASSADKEDEVIGSGDGTNTEATTRSASGSTAEKTTKETTIERATSGSSSEKATKEPTTERTTSGPSTEATAKESATEATTRSTSGSTTEKTTKETTTEKATSGSTTEKTTKESTTETTTRITSGSTAEKTTKETTTEAATSKTTEKITEKTTEKATSEASTTSTSTTTHTHVWVWKTHKETVHHDAETHQEPVYDYDWSDPNLVGVYFNGEWIDGYPIYEDKIIDSKGHIFDTPEDYDKARAEGWATGTTCCMPVLVNVIPAEKVIVDYETIVDQEAYDEEIEVKDYEYCSECGKRK